MNNFITGITNLCTTLQPLSKPLLLVALLAGGICMIIPSDEFHAKAMKIIPFSLAGFGIVVTAIELGASFASAF